MNTSDALGGAPAHSLRPLIGARRRWLLGLALAAVAIGFLLWAVDVVQLQNAIGAVVSRPLLITAFVVPYTLAFALRAMAWRALLPGLGRFEAFSILQAALVANHLFPMKVGEVLRPYLANRNGALLGDAVASSVLVRLLDYVSLLALATLLLGTLAAPFGLAGGLLAPALIVLIAGGGLFVLRDWSPLGRGHVPSWLARAQAALRNVTPRQLWTAAVWTLPSWALEGAVVYVAAEALGVELGWLAAIGVTAVTIVFQAFHFTPGGVGVYEASMTAALSAFGVPPDNALTLAVLAHGLKFVYSFSVALAFGAFAVQPLLRRRQRIVGHGHGHVHAASRFELVMARLWNVANEGKPFTVVFVIGIVAIMGVMRGFGSPEWGRAVLSLLALSPLFAVLYRFDFPLKLRAALWGYLALFLVAFRFVDGATVIVAVSLYFGFTVVLWGSIYYHLRIGTPLTNFTRFWRLVIENPDTTSGNFLEQIPKALLVLLMFGFLFARASWQAFLEIEAFALLVGVSALLLHQWFFTWAPPPPLSPTRLRGTPEHRVAKRFITIVIDGCRADRLREARTPVIDRLRREGTEFTDVRTVHPARTVTCFSSMLTGASPAVHGMTSNFAPRLGVRCDSMFDALARQGMSGKLVGIAHLVDAFGEGTVRTVSAVTRNEEVDDALAERAKRVLLEERPEALVLQLISVDQTGHARGSYHREYVERIEAADRTIGEFLAWCQAHGFLDDTTVLITADHGQGIGIGGHGHLTKTELNVPCIFWGAGVDAGVVCSEPRSILDVAPTIGYFLGVAPPEQSVGQVLLAPGAAASEESPLALIVPAYNEAARLSGVLARIPREALPGLRVIVVDDGSTDGSADVARCHGAHVVVTHARNRGLGAALRTGLEAARAANARAAVYIDADGEYDPMDIPAALAPIEAGSADYVLGSRFLGERRGQPWGRALGNRAFTALLNLASGRRITDGQTGLRAFSRRALEVAEVIHDYNYAQVLTLDLLKKGMRLAEVPITYQYKGKGRSFVKADYLWRVPTGMLREMLRP